MATALAHPVPHDISGEALLPRDRCDRCGAQAFVRAVFSNGDLLFCGHHWRAYEPSAAVQAVTVFDERERINAEPSPAAY